MTLTVNIDIQLFKGVDVVADANLLPFPPGYFQKIFSHNPYDYNPVSKEIADILEKEGILIVTGQPRNQFIKDILDMSSEELLTLGLEFMEKGPVEPSLIVGVPKTTTGKLLSTKVMIQVIYRKIK